MTSTLGQLFTAHGEALLDAVPWLQSAWGHLNRSPLGSASGYGVALPLDRQRVSDLLGFDRLQVNTLAVQNDRGKGEWLTLGAALLPVTDAARLAADLIWFSSDELGCLRLAPAVTTGSSIMPQKRNPDVLELVRAAAAQLRSRHGELLAIVGGLPSGYHRDLQATKEPFLTGLTGAADALAALLPVLETLTVDEAACRRVIQRATAATDEVYRRVAAGVPFRTAYRQVGEDPAGAVRGDPAESWRLRTHAGAPGAIDASYLGYLDERARAAGEWLAARSVQVEEIWRRFESGFGLVAAPP
jgi:argininosuccinate lyase